MALNRIKVNIFSWSAVASSYFRFFHSEFCRTSYPNVVTLSSILWLINSKPSSSLNRLRVSNLSTAHYSSRCESSGSDSDESLDYEEDGMGQPMKTKNNDTIQGFRELLSILHKPDTDRSVWRSKIERCGVKVTSELVLKILSRVRNDWEVAFTFFIWAGKQEGYSHTTREYNSMISILGKMRRFDTASSLISEMKRHDPPLVTPHTLKIMIRKYCAVHDIAKAINTFQSYKRYNFSVGMEEFHMLLSALCRYKNIPDAEHLMITNRNLFPLNTKSFNMILNGWCNVIPSPRHAERVWREMAKWGIEYDVVSFSCMMSCYSKMGGIYRVFKWFNSMKQMGIEPNRNVYNSLIHSLAKTKSLKEAKGVIKTMEEKGINPNSVTYNSLINPLCNTEKIEEAKEVFDEMLNKGLSPTERTLHGLLRVLKTSEEVFVLMKKMRSLKCPFGVDTYSMLIKKFCRWRQFDVAQKLWEEMREDGVSHDRSSYSTMIYGLFLNGKVEEAYGFYVEMKEKGFVPEEKMDAIMKRWFCSKDLTEVQIQRIRESEYESGKVRGNRSGKDFVKDAAVRRVFRERGFSFLLE